jgi:Family of unknown function (DUF6338)
MLLIAPGLTFELLWERKRPSQQHSAFREASRVALTSVVFSGLSLTLLSVVRVLKHEWIPDPGAWLRAPESYVASHYRLIGRTLLVELALAIGFAVLASWWLSRRGSGDIAPVSIWFQVFRTKTPEGMLPFVKVQVKSGSVYGGVVSGYRTDLPLEDRELVLSPPLSWRPTASEDPQDLPLDWERVVLAGSEIQVMWVSYIPREEAKRQTIQTERMEREAQQTPAGSIAAAGP